MLRGKEFNHSMCVVDARLRRQAEQELLWPGPLFIDVHLFYGQDHHQSRQQFLTDFVARFIARVDFFDVQVVDHCT